MIVILLFIKCFTFQIAFKIFFVFSILTKPLFFFIIFNDFAIDNKNIYISKQHDFYVFQFDKFVTCLTINQNILILWHKRLNYLNFQNII